MTLFGQINSNVIRNIKLEEISHVGKIKNDRCEIK